MSHKRTRYPLAILLALGAALASAAEAPPAIAKQAPGTFVWRGHYFLTSEPALAWNPVHGVFLGWGGHHLGHEQSDDAWVFSPDAPGWKLMPQINGPRACCCANQLGLDTRRGQLLIFSGDGDQSHGWMSVTVQGFKTSIPTLYDCAANRWIPMRPVPEPPGGVRQHKGFVYHPGLDLHVLVAGKEAPNDTWVYDPHRNEWRELHPANPPAPQKHEAVLAVHPDTGEIIRVNGNTNGTVHVLSIAANAWRKVALSNAPPPLVEPCFVFDPHADRFVLLGSLEKGKGDPLQIWTLDRGLSAWQRVELPEEGEAPGRTRKMSGFGFAAAYSPERNVYLLVGGEFGNKRFHTWTWRLAATRPQLPPASAALQPPVRVGPPAPAAPAVAGIATNAVDLALPQPAAAAGRFLIERAPVRTQRHENKFKHVQVAMELGSFAPVVAAPVAGASFTDPLNLHDIPDGWRFEQPSNAIAAVYGREFAPEARYNPLAVYAYRVREVDAAGATSGPSPWVLTLPEPPDTPAVTAPPPDDPLSGIVTLSWNAPRQKGIAGYRVYRQSQRYLGPLWQNPWVAPYHLDPKVWFPLGPRLVAGTRFVDDTIPGGNNRRRYYVAAVDALGQEGPPSSGAWAYRAESFDLPGPLTNLPHARIPDLAEAATIDGELNDAAWQQAARFTLRHLDGRFAPPANPTEVSLFTHAGWLYGAGTCHEEVMAEVVAHTNWPHDCNFLWMDDTLEFSFLLDPRAEGAIHHLMFSASGLAHDAYGPLGALDKKAWDPAVESATKKGDRAWRVEFRLRLEDFRGYDPAKTAWRANLFRNRQQTAHREQEESAWSPPCFSEPMVPARYGSIEIGPTVGK